MPLSREPGTARREQQLRSRRCLADVDAKRSNRRGQPIERVARRGQQLLGGPRVAEIVCAFAEESVPAAAHVQPRAHPITLFGRRRDLDRGVERQLRDARERVGDHVALELQLPRIGDVGVQTAAA